MDVKNFLINYRPRMSEYCDIVIDWEGKIYECDTSHLNKMIDLSGDKEILSKIPIEASPMFWLIIQLKCVLVDYNYQIFSNEMSDKQFEALEALAGKGLISLHTKDIHGVF